MAPVPQEVISSPKATRPVECHGCRAFAAIEDRPYRPGQHGPRKHGTPHAPFRWAGYYLVCALAATLACLTGCAATADLLRDHSLAPPTGTPAQVNVAWHNQVIFAPDPVQGGKVSPGLVGRLYLFGPDMGYPFTGDGRVTVDLFDPAQPEKDGNPKQLERWIVEQDTLARCLRRDTIGWGYTLLLPWATYRPDLAQVLLKVRYDPPKGVPIYSQPTTVTFNPVQDLQVAKSSKPITPANNGSVVPASHFPPPGNH